MPGVSAAGEQEGRGKLPQNLCLAPHCRSVISFRENKFDKMLFVQSSHALSPHEVHPRVHPIELAGRSHV